MAGTQKLGKVVLMYEAVLILLFGGLMSIERPVILVWLAFFIWAFFRFFQSLVTSKMDINAIGVNYTYQYLFPFFILVFLSFQDWLWCFVALTHVLFLVPGHYIEKLVNLLKEAWSLFLRFLLIDIRHFLSMLFNYPIYYLFLLFGVDLKKEGKSAMEYLSKRKQ